MPRMDGTGPMGYRPMMGGRRGWCVGDAAGASRGAGAGMGLEHGSGRGQRNHYYATGLTGWQRAAQFGPAPAQAAATQADPIARIQDALADVLDRLERLEAVGQKS